MAYAPRTLAERRGNRPKVEREAIPANPTGFAHLIDELDAIAADAQNDPALARFLGCTLAESKANAIAAKAKKPIEIFRKGGANAMAWLAVAQMRATEPRRVRLTTRDIRIEPRHGGGWWGPTHVARGLLVDSRCAAAIIGDYSGWSFCPGTDGVLVVTGDLELQAITMFGELRVLGELRVRTINNGGRIVVGRGGYALSVTKGVTVEGPMHVGKHRKVPAQGVHPNQREK